MPFHCTKVFVVASILCSCSQSSLPDKEQTKIVEVVICNAVLPDYYGEMFKRLEDSYRGADPSAVTDCFLEMPGGAECSAELISRLREKKIVVHPRSELIKDNIVAKSNGAWVSLRHLQIEKNHAQVEFVWAKVKSGRRSDHHLIERVKLEKNFIGNWYLTKKF